MIRILTIAFLLMDGASSLCLAEAARLEGQVFLPTAPVRWAATNALPESVTLYKTGPTNFSPSVLSNVLAITSMKPINLAPSGRPGVLHFTRREPPAVRVLEISQEGGWMTYSGGLGYSPSAHGVPSDEETKELAREYLDRLGGDTNQLRDRPMLVSEAMTTRYAGQFGKEIGKAVTGRGVTLRRQIDGMDGVGYFQINFGNDAEPAHFDWHWKALTPDRKVKCADLGKIVSWVKAGKAVVLPNRSGTEPVSLEPKFFTITEATPRYDLDALPGFAYPFVRLAVEADMGGTNKVLFRLECPISAEIFGE